MVVSISLASRWVSGHLAVVCARRWSFVAVKIKRRLLEGHREGVTAIAPVKSGTPGDCTFLSAFKRDDRFIIDCASAEGGIDRTVRERRHKDGVLFSCSCSSLVFLHDTCGISHGDIKPESAVLRQIRTGRRGLWIVEAKERAFIVCRSKEIYGTSVNWAPELLTRIVMDAPEICLRLDASFTLLYGAHPLDPEGSARMERFENIAENRWSFLDDEHLHE